MRKAIIIFPVIMAVFLACRVASVEPPVAEPIALLSPVNGATLTDPVTITAKVGGGYSFTLVDFYIDSLLVFSDSTAPYQYYWNIFNYNANTTHLLYAIGYSADSSFRSANISVSITYSFGFSIAADYRPNTQHAIGIRAYQNVVFVPQGDQGLEVLDIINVNAPAFHSRFNTQGQLTHAVASFPYLYISAGTQGVVEVNFSDVDSLVEIARFMDQGFIKDVKFIGNNILVLENSNVVILNKNNPDSLIELSRLAIPAVFYYAATQGTFGYLAGDNSLYIVDCSNPSNINLTGVFDNLGLALGVAVSDTFAFVANGDQGVTAISVANPHNPRFLSRFNPEPYILAVATGDNTLFAAGRDGDIYALGFNNADTLSQIDHLNIGNLLIGEIDYQFPYLFVAANPAVEILRFVR